MRSRMAITTMLVAGLLMSSTGAGLALSGGGSASIAQYSPGTGGNGPGDIRGAGDTRDNGGGGGQVPVAQPNRQIATPTNGTLPFTGFLTSTVIAAGLALLATGLLMRWKTRPGATE